MHSSSFFEEWAVNGFFGGSPLEKVAFLVDPGDSKRKRLASMAMERTRNLLADPCLEDLPLFRRAGVDAQRGRAGSGRMVSAVLAPRNVLV